MTGPACLLLTGVARAAKSHGVLALLVSAAVASATTTPVDARRSSDDQESRWVPFDLTIGNQIRFETRINGQAATAILDTGVSRSVLSRRFAGDHGLVVTTGGNVAAIGGSVAVDHATVQRIDIGGLSRAANSLQVVTLPATATGGPDPVDLLVGQDLIGGSAIDIDYPRRRFRLLPSGRLPFRGESAPLAIVPGIELSVTETRIGDTRQRSMMIDTGDGASLTYSQETWRTANVSAAGARTTALAYGLAGPLVTELTMLPAVALGNVEATDVEVRIEPGGGYSRSLGVGGRIGNGLLQRYRVLIDAPAGRLVLAPGHDADRPPPISTSGIQALVESTRLRVVHVMRGSPAEAGGWRPGDLICSIDGQAIGTDYQGSALAGWTVDTPGRNVRIGLCNGEARHLTLRQFY